MPEFGQHGQFLNVEGLDLYLGGRDGPRGGRPMLLQVLVRGRGRVKLLMVNRG